MTDNNIFECNDTTYLQRIIKLNIEDKRDKIAIVYPLYVVASIVIMARIAGCNNCRSQRLFWIENLKHLKELFYDLDDGVPSEQTIRRLISMVKAEETLGLLTEHFAPCQKNSQASSGSIPLSKRDVIAADGQNIRATRLTREDNDARKSTGYDIVSMYSSKYGMTISQRTVDKKNTDAKAILDMIASLNLKNTILTWDAINTRTSVLRCSDRS